MTKNYFQILGVTTEATQAEIKDAYKKLAIRLHPDKNPDNPEAAQEFQAIAEAYEVLGDFYQRLLYEKELNGTYEPSLPETPEPSVITEPTETENGKR